MERPKLACSLARFRIALMQDAYGLTSFVDLDQRIR
jgi:hypothetical protein